MKNTSKTGGAVAIIVILAIVAVGGYLTVRYYFDKSPVVEASAPNTTNSSASPTINADDNGSGHLSSY